MKRFLISLVSAISFVSTANANNEFCSTMGDSAQITMTARQSGLAVSAAMSSIPVSAGERERKILQFIIIEAYKIPRYSTVGMQNQAIQEFRNSIEVACYSTFNK